MIEHKILEKLCLKHPVKYYHYISQAELKIADMDDKEQMKITDVRINIEHGQKCWE